LNLLFTKVIVLVFLVAMSLILSGRTRYIPEEVTWDPQKKEKNPLPLLVIDRPRFFPVAQEQIFFEQAGFWGWRLLGMVICPAQSLPSSNMTRLTRTQGSFPLEKLPAVSGEKRAVKHHCAPLRKDI
jgi:hypothetical protein